MLTGEVYPGFGHQGSESRDEIGRAAWLCRPETRIVIREANTLSFDNAGGTKPFNRLVPNLLRRWYSAADGIVCVSEGVAQDLAEFAGLPRGRLITIYNPVDLERVAHLAAEPLDHPWFEAGSPPVLLSVGRLARQKDHPTLLRALAEVRARREVRLVILGEGGAREELEHLRASLGLENAVASPGQTRNPYRHMARAAVFVSSSAWEGFPNVLLEALARTILESLDAPRDPERQRSRAAVFSMDAATDLYLAAMLGETAAR